MAFRGRRVVSRYHFYYAVFFCTLLAGVVLAATFQFWPHDLETPPGGADSARQTVIIRPHTPPAAASDRQCLFHTCFDVYHCGYNADNTISVYIYPYVHFVDAAGVAVSLPLSREFAELREAIAHSRFSISDPDKACLFLPQIDLLNENSVRPRETSQSLAALPRYASWMALLCNY